MRLGAQHSKKELLKSRRVVDRRLVLGALLVELPERVSDRVGLDLGIARTDNPALPCLIASAGFACSDWIDVTADPVQIDILFGEVGGRLTSGLLLIEREGEQYEETFWGQPKWPLFLTESPQDSELPELNNLLKHLEEKTMGSFSIANDAIWKVNTSTPSSTIE